MYTRSGDKGETSLYGGERVPKSSMRVEAYGGVDELNSLLGVAKQYVRHPELVSIIRAEQLRLFKAGADLATPMESKTPKTVKRITPEDIMELESVIDSIEVRKLDKFVVPGSDKASAYLHLSRAVCRRVERGVWALARTDESVNPVVATYLNRLSSLLYVLARRVAELDGVDEDLWVP